MCCLAYLLLLMCKPNLIRCLITFAYLWTFRGFFFFFGAAYPKVCRSFHTIWYPFEVYYSNCSLKLRRKWLLILIVCLCWRKGNGMEFHILNTPSSFCFSSGGHWCGCSSYSSLLYVLSSAVGVLLLLLLLTGCVLCKVSVFFWLWCATLSMLVHRGKRVKSNWSISTSSTCLLRSRLICSSPQKPRWFHNFVQPVINMFVLKFSEEHFQKPSSSS